MPIFEDIFEQNNIKVPFFTTVILKWFHSKIQNGALTLIIIMLFIFAFNMFRGIC